MSYVGDDDAIDEAADTWTPAVITAKPSTTRTSGTIDFMEVPHVPRRPNRHLTLLQTENLTREPHEKRSSTLSKAILNLFVQPVTAAPRSLQPCRTTMSSCRHERASHAIKYPPSDSFPRGLEMPNYISLGNWTEQGIKNVKESPKRADAVTALANKLGAKMQIFYTMGRYDIVALTEAPNDDVAMQLLLEIGKLGNVKTQTLKAWTTSEATKVISKLQ